MRNNRAFAVAALAFLLAVSPAHAATYANASRLVAAMSLRAEIDNAIGDAVGLVRAGLEKQGLAPDKIDQFVAAFRDELEAAAPDLVRATVQNYADRFSDAEVDDLLAFYETPTGQKLVSVQRELVAGQVAAVGNWINAAAQRATEKLQASGASV